MLPSCMTLEESDFWMQTLYNVNVLLLPELDTYGNSSRNKLIIAEVDLTMVIYYGP